MSEPRVRADIPYVRLSTFYFFYFASLGALLPYWGLYLEARGFDAAQIGLAMGILLGAKVFAPYLWGWVADHLGRRMALIRAATFAAILSFVLITQVESYAGLLAVLLLYAFFWNASLPQFEAVTLNFLGERADEYGRIRLWGSIGFIASVLALGPLIARLGPLVLPWCVLPVLGAKWVATLLLPEPGRQPHEHGSGGGILAALREPGVVALLAVCFLMQFSHGPYYGFYTLYMRDLGYGESLIGALWALGVAAEILVFLAMPRWLRNHGPRQLMLAALGLTTLRWLLLASVAQWLPLALLIQVLHMVSFGLYHAVGIHLINLMFRGPLQGRGQALYSAVSFGAGGAAGSICAGLLWDAAPPSAVYLLAASAAGLGFVIARRGLHPAAPSPAPAPPH